MRGIRTFEFCDNFGGGKFGSLYSVKIYSGGWLSGREIPLLWRGARQGGVVL